ADRGDRAPVAGFDLAPLAAGVHRRAAARPSSRGADGRLQLRARPPGNGHAVQAHLAAATGAVRADLPELAAAEGDRPHPGERTVGAAGDARDAGGAVRPPGAVDRAGRAGTGAARGLNGLRGAKIAFTCARL